MFPDDSFLRRALLANAAFSGVSALVLVAAAGPVGRFLGSVDPSNLYVVGAGLGLFSLALVWQSRSERVNPLLALGATLADLAWVAGSGALLIVRPASMSDAGLAAVTVVAAVVLALAVAQLEGLRRFARNRRGDTDLPSMFSMTCRLDAPAGRVWDRLEALERIDDFYDELAEVDVEETAGRTVRTCVDREGRRWSEEVLEMDRGARILTLRFVAEADDFPFPVTSMVGGWEVAARDGGSDLTLWYEYALPGGFLGEIAAALAAPSLEKRMAPVVHRLGAATASADSLGVRHERPA